MRVPTTIPVSPGEPQKIRAGNHLKYQILFFLDTRTTPSLSPIEVPFSSIQEAPCQSETVLLSGQ